MNTRTQVWNCRGCGTGGDVIKLVCHLDGIDFRTAVETLAVAPDRPAKDEAKQKAAANKVRAEENTYKLGALRIWRESGACDDGGLAARYLREERGIAISPDDWKYLSPRVIRFHSSCPFGKDKGGKQLYHPAMICLFRNVATDAGQAIFRVALTPDGKKTGGLAYGPRGANSFAGLAAIKHFDDADGDQGLVLAEGVETALAAAYCGGYRPVWAMAGVDGIAAFPVLPGAGGLMLLAEKDKPGVTASADAVRECGARWTEADREVIVWESDCGDFNDAARRIADGR